MEHSEIEKIRFEISGLGAMLARMCEALECSARAAEATHALYKKANDDTKRHMDFREEREREANDRAKMDFAMSKERHEAFMNNEKLKQERENAWFKKIQEEGGSSNLIK